MIEKIRFRCPCCGMSSSEDHLESDKPYPIKILLHQFGGKVAGSGYKGRGKAPGFMRYIDITKSRPDLIEKVKRRLIMVSKLIV